MKYYKHQGKVYSTTRDLAAVLQVSLPYQLTQEQCDSLGVELCDSLQPATIEELRSEKLTVLKEARDSQEVLPIEYNGNIFDYDDTARDRINAAIIALELQGEDADISWTTADNAETVVTAMDLKRIVGAVAIRSNILHVAYRVAAAKVAAAKSQEELEVINLVLSE
jgi:hypothetical protein